MLAEAEAKYLARVVQEATLRVDQAIRAGYRPDSADALLIRDAVELCGREVPLDPVLCRAILKQTPRKTLERLLSGLARNLTGPIVLIGFR